MIPFKQAKVVDEIKGTVGGVTYLVMLPGNSAAQKLCFRRIHKNKAARCTNPAGYGTEHLGTGACKFHGGNNAANMKNLTTGKTATSTRLHLKERIDEYLNDDRSKLLDLTKELAASKAILDAIIDQFPEIDEDTYGMWLNRFYNVVTLLGNLVERMSKIENRNTLTAAQALYLKATVADLLMKYIIDPEMRERAAKELAVRLGGDVSIEMQRSEIYSLNSGS